jgi:hypothetical protein
VNSYLQNNFRSVAALSLKFFRPFGASSCFLLTRGLRRGLILAPLRGLNIRRFGG